MATFTAVGPATTLDGPIPVPPPHSLVETLRLLPEEVWGELLVEVEAGARPRWLNGAGVLGYPSDLPLAWYPCDSGTYRTKSDASSFPVRAFDPFGIYLPIACSAMGWPDNFEDRAEQALEAKQSYTIARTLASRPSGSDNPFFGAAGMVRPAGNTPVSPAIGIRYLEDAIGDTGLRGFIHITPPVGAALQPIRISDDPERDPLVTAVGNVIVIDGGYADLDPEGSAAAPTATQAWAYATGPIALYLTDVFVTPEDMADALDTSNNDVVRYAERYVLPVWDGVLRAGVLIDWSL